MKWIALVALATVAYAAQDQLLLRRELKTGVTETYKIESQIKQNMDIPSLGEQDLVINTIASCAVTTKNVDTEKGTADVETLTKLEKATLDGSIAQMMGGGQEQKLPDPKTEKGTLDSRNRLTIGKDPKDKASVSPLPGMEMMQGMATTPSAQTLLSLIELPEKSIKIGDSWDAGLPGGASSMGAGVKDVKITIKFVGERQIDGQTVYVLATTGTFKLDVDTSKLPKKEGAAASPMGDVKMTGTAELSGEGLVDKATGKTISNSITVKNNASVHVAQMGADIPVKGTVTMTLKLQK